MNLEQSLHEVGHTAIRWLPIVVAGMWAVTGAVKVGYGAYLQHEGNDHVRQYVPSSPQYASYNRMIDRGETHVGQGLPMTGEGGLGSIVGLGFWAIVPPATRPKKEAQ